MGSSIKTLASLLVFSALIGGVYLASQKYGLLDTSAQLQAYETSVANLEREVFVRLGQINAITLDTTIFTRTEYKALKDLRVELPKPVVSRTDPFADL